MKCHWNLTHHCLNCNLSDELIKSWYIHQKKGLIIYKKWMAQKSIHIASPWRRYMEDNRHIFRYHIHIQIYHIIIESLYFHSQHCACWWPRMEPFLWDHLCPCICIHTHMYVTILAHSFSLGFRRNVCRFRYPFKNISQLTWRIICTFFM